MWKSKSQSQQRKVYLKNWRKNHRKSINLGVAIWLDNKRHQVLEKLGNKCIKCGFTDKRALQIDHINGGGYQENKLLSWPKRYEKMLNDNGSNYQLLCANCNWIKRYEKGEWRNRRKK